MALQPRPTRPVRSTSSNDLAPVTRPTPDVAGCANSSAHLTSAYVAETERRIRPYIFETPTLYHETLSERLDVPIFLKYENAQRTGAFKARGAIAKLLTLTEAEQRAGVIAMSAGNHAQGVASFGRRMNIPVTIVMPENTPFTKVRKVKAFGAEVVLAGETFAEAAHVAEIIATQRHHTLIHPYNDLDVIAGQGTVALEMLRQAPAIDTLIVPVGGGGLIAGCAIAAAGCGRNIKVVGVQSDIFPGMLNALQGEKAPPGGHTVAEGIAVQVPGSLTVPFVKSHVDSVIEVGEQSIEQAISLLATTAMTVVEGAGAVALAAVLEHGRVFRNRTVGLILSGGNIDARLLSSVLMRELVRAGQVLTLQVEMSDKPGQLYAVSGICAKHGANILEVSHNRFGLDLSARAARLAVTIETRDDEHARLVVEELRSTGYAVDVTMSY